MLLEDTRAALPPYDAVVLLGHDAEQRHPGVRRALATLDGTIDGAAMRSANRHVDLDGGTIGAAAALLGERLPAPDGP